MLLFLFLAVVVAVGKFRVIVRMRMPIGAVFVVVAEPAGMVMADVPMVVIVLDSRMRVRAGLAFAVGTLCPHPMYSSEFGSVSAEPATCQSALRAPSSVRRR